MRSGEKLTSLPQAYESFLASFRETCILKELLANLLRMLARLKYDVSMGNKLDGVLTKWLVGGE